MEPIKILRSRTVVLPMSDIDTDQIIPARFLTTTTRSGLGAHLFADWRYGADGAPKADFVLNGADARGCAVLVAGTNFGCGSSREHAPWALTDYGFRAVVSTQIADIFRSNSLKNGLVPVIVDAATHGWLMEHPGAEVTLDLASTTLTLPTGKAVRFPLEPFARYCLMNGVDELGFLLGREKEIRDYERAAG
ncbi:MAG TPA: 3-isopropylmalate dehydratase small subunit [Steroidobacteraceae bacterium]|nr:3-isopropylmalate dehydratase small subunit [Steroidobacteraceae bacterium]